MAGTGSAPKQSSARTQRRGTFSFDPTPIEPAKLPKAPPAGWHPRAKASWQTMTSQGFVVMWLESDWVLAERWLLLIDRMHRALDDPEANAALIRGMAAEARAIEGLIGMTPVSRAALRWQANTAAPVTPLRSVSTSARSPKSGPVVLATYSDLMGEESDQ